jgi:hypothetical protein
VAFSSFESITCTVSASPEVQLSARRVGARTVASYRGAAASSSSAASLGGAAEPARGERVDPPPEQRQHGREDDERHGAG